MTDTELLNWLERHYATVYAGESRSHFVVVNEKAQVRRGFTAKNLREAIRRAASKDASTFEGNDR